MNHLDLFSGIGGFSLAASWVWGEDHNIISFVEIDEFCQKVLNKHWPNVPIISDIRDVTYERILADTESKRQRSGIQGERIELDRTKSGRNTEQRRKEKAGERTKIDLLTGGFPCQPYSVAGKQGGSEDDRHLWPQMLRVIREIRPTWVIGENVAGIINMELDQVLSDLEDSEYEAQPFLIPACGQDAPHQRFRVWIVANSISKHDDGSGYGTSEVCGEWWEAAELSGCQDVADTEERTVRPGLCKKEPDEIGRQRFSDGSRWLPEPNVGRVAHGVSGRVDRLKSLGNSIVPQCVYPIMQAIKAIDQLRIRVFWRF